MAQSADTTRISHQSSQMSDKIGEPHSDQLPTELADSSSTFSFSQRLASFDNLVALANHQERLREHAVTARKLVWRDKGEPAEELTDLWDVVEHSARGGLRAFTMGYGIRASLNIVLALLRFRKIKPDMRMLILRRAIIGSDTIDFGSMLGVFVAIYKLLLNLPIALPSSRQPSQARAQSAETSSGAMTPGIAKIASETGLPAGKLSKNAEAHQVMVRKKTRRWQAMLSGVIAGAVGIVFEKRSRRSGVAQQMFVRGLQGSWNSFSKRKGFSVPHGAVMIFSVCCAQIMYAFLVAPETLDRGYTNWIQMASKTPPESVAILTSMIRQQKFDPELIDQILAKGNIAPRNITDLLSRKAAAMASPPDYGTSDAICAAIHPHTYSCASTYIPTFFEVAQWMLPVYGTLTFVPMFLFRRGAIARRPMEMILKAAISTFRSSAFLGVFVIIFRIWLCYKNWAYSFIKSRTSLPSWVANLFRSHASFWIGGFFSGLSILIEKRQRRSELALYVLPKGLESAWAFAQGSGWVSGTGAYGDVLLTAIGMGMVMDTYQNAPIHLSSFVRKILFQFVGPN